MRILVDARTFGDKPSGIGIYTYNFLKEIVKRKDVEIELVSDISNSEEMGLLSECENVNVHLLGKKVQKTFAVIGYMRYVQKVIHDVTPQIFWEPNNLFPIKLVNPYGKIVVTIHDMFPLYMSENYGKIYPNYFRIGIKNTIKYTDALLYNSKETKRITEKYYPTVKDINSEVLYIPIEKEVNVPIEDKGYFLYIGNLENRKGTDILVRAFEKYKEAGGNKNLILAGKIREEEIKILLEDVKKQTNSIEYMGYVSESQKDELLANCSCFVFPSRAEGFGIPIIEAMFFEKPVIASNLSIFSEIVGECINVFSLENWEEELPRMLSADFEKELDTKAYKKVCERYSAKTLTDTLMEHFAEWSNYA